MAFRFYFVTKHPRSADLALFKEPVLKPEDTSLWNVGESRVVFCIFVVPAQNSGQVGVSKRTCLRVTHVAGEWSEDLFGKNIPGKNRFHQHLEAHLPFVAMRFNLVAEMEVNTQVRHFMDVGDEEEVWIEVVIQGDARMWSASLTCEITDLRLSCAGDLELEGCLLPKCETIGQRRSWKMGL